MPIPIEPIPAESKVTSWDVEHLQHLLGVKGKKYVSLALFKAPFAWRRTPQGGAFWQTQWELGKLSTQGRKIIELTLAEWRKQLESA